MGSIFTVDLSNVSSLLLKFTGAGCVRGTISYIYYKKEKDITERTMTCKMCNYFTGDMMQILEILCWIKV